MRLTSWAVGRAVKSRDSWAVLWAFTAESVHAHDTTGRVSNESDLCTGAGSMVLLDVGVESVGLRGESA